MNLGTTNNFQNLLLHLWCSRHFPNPLCWFPEWPLSRWTILSLLQVGHSLLGHLAVISLPNLDHEHWKRIETFQFLLKQLNKKNLRVTPKKSSLGRPGLTGVGVGLLSVIAILYSLVYYFWKPKNFPHIIITLFTNHVTRSISPTSEIISLGFIKSNL